MPSPHTVNIICVNLCQLSLIDRIEQICSNNGLAPSKSRMLCKFIKCTSKLTDYLSSLAPFTVYIPKTITISHEIEDPWT